MSKNANFHVSFKIILKNKNGAILVLECPDSSQMKGYYDFPGGRILDSEVTMQFGKIIKRELEEELGSQIKYRLKPSPVALGRHFFYWDTPSNKDRQDIFWVFFEAEYLGGKVKISDEHKDFKWVKLNKNNLDRYFIHGPLEGMQNYFFKSI
jgi:8-oxo-dGTP diphosphatase